MLRRDADGYGVVCGGRDESPTRRREYDENAIWAWLGGNKGLLAEYQTSRRGVGHHSLADRCVSATQKSLKEVIASFQELRRRTSNSKTQESGLDMRTIAQQIEFGMERVGEKCGAGGTIADSKEPKRGQSTDRTENVNQVALRALPPTLGVFFRGRRSTVALESTKIQQIKFSDALGKNRHIIHKLVLLSCQKYHQNNFHHQLG